MAWHDEYPHKIYQTVLLLDGKIYNWKIGGSSRKDKLYWKMRFEDFSKVERMETFENEIVVNNDLEHNLAFNDISWFRQWAMHEHAIGGSPFSKSEDFI